MKFDSGFDRVTTSTDVTGIGGGPVWGIQFNLNDRLSLQTEAALYALSSTTKEKSQFSSNPEFNTNDKSNNMAIAFTLPTSVFFVVRF